MKNRYEKRGDHFAIFANSRGMQHEILVDEEDFEAVAAFPGTWGAYKGGNTFYAQIWIRDANGKWKKVQMHRVILNPPADLQVDHKNHNGLDNRRANIRIVTRGENGRNRIDNVEFQSEVDGVTRHSRNKTWRVQIKVNGRVEYSAGFRDQAKAEEAARRFRETGERTTHKEPAKFQSGIKGITWDAKARAWQVHAPMNGKQIFLGYFGTVSEAHAALLMYQETGMRVKRNRKNRCSGSICSRKGSAL